MDVFVDSVRYQVDQTIKGGMGTVWLVSRADAEIDDVYLSRLAVKTFDELKNNINVEKELNNWITLEHSNILKLLKIGRLNYGMAALMPRRQESVSDYSLRSGTLPINVVVQIVMQIFAALEYAYDVHALAHLDIKPQNVLIRSFDPIQVEVSDWGISRAAEIQQSGWFGLNAKKHATKFGVGTLPFMAPERFSGKWVIDHKADIFSVGIMTVQLLTGRLPFESTEMVVDEIVSGAYVKRMRNLLQNQPKQVSRFCLSCADPYPRNRPETYRDAASLALEI